MAVVSTQPDTSIYVLKKDFFGGVHSFGGELRMYTLAGHYCVQEGHVDKADDVCAEEGYRYLTFQSPSLLKGFCHLSSSRCSWYL